MSQRDHDLMESVTADQAISVPASPPPRDSMEDADPSLTRKRPRLDGGSIDTPAMHTDSATSACTTPPSSDQQVEMTIRSQPTSLSHTRDGAHDTSDHLAPTTPAEDIEITAAMAGDADSPPVVAIDDNDDAETMAGYAAAAPLPVGYDADDYFASFPFAQHGNYMHAVHEIVQYVQGNQNVEGNVLRQLTIWLDGLPSHPLLWRSFYMEQLPFWDEISMVVHKIFGRRSPFGDPFCDDTLSEEDIITSFLVSYLRLLSRLMQVDAAMLSQWTSEESYTLPLLTQKHFRNVNTIIRQTYTPTPCHVFNLLRKEYQVDVESMCVRLLKAFLEADGAKNVFDLAKQACGKVPLPFQNIIAMNVAAAVDSICCAISNYPFAEEIVNKDDFYRHALAFFRQYNSDLQNPSKVVDTVNTRELIVHFFILLFDICLYNPTMAAELQDEFLDFRDPQSPTAAASPDESTVGRASYLQDPTELPRLISNAWKFKLLRKYVVKGRMELRVMSIGFMDASLVELWKDYSTTVVGIKHPVMLYLADFLLHERVVDYIISVDSHPQLISRSGNIVGFLVVTRRYSDAQTDAIWNTVAHSSDPRVVSATMTMLRSIFNLMEQADLLHLCSKLYELPVESYNADILRFLRELTHKLVEKPPEWNYTDPHARPWNVCIRVVQDTSPGKETSKLFTNLHLDAVDQLRAVASHIPLEERYQLLRECAAHIASKSSKATGSVRAIYILASVVHFGEPTFFQEYPDAARDILEEICFFVRNETDMALNTTQCLALSYRLELLSLLIYGAPDAVPPDLYQDLWEHLIGRYAHTNQVRDMAWSKFLDAVKHKPDNDFCKQLVTVCVPTLDPRYYTHGMFDFVAAYRFQTTRRIVTTEQGEKELLQIRGADLLWAMILSAPPHTIEDRAAKLLASRYLKIDPDQGVDLEELEEVHVALVDQRVKELLSLYATLRTGSLATTPNVEQMDIVLSGPLKEQKEQHFARTILFLKLLLGFIRKQPELNRSKRSDSKVEPLDIELPSGEAIEVKYTSPIKSGIQSIIIGSENTLQDLYTRLCHATGFTILNLFAKGQRLSVVDKANEKIADLDLATQVLITQKTLDSEVSQPVPDHSGSSSVFEMTVLSHFNKLFACMDADDYISSVVYDFLVCFPFRDTIPEAEITGGTASFELLFPPGKPWQAKYAALALDGKLRGQVRRNSVDDKFLAGAVRLLDQALLSPSLLGEQLTPQSDLLLAQALVQVLLNFLKERPARDTSSIYFSDERRLVERMLRLVSVALSSDEDMGFIAYHSYCVVVEASLHSREVWEAFIGHNAVGTLHEALLLSDVRKRLRENIAKIISSVCGGALSPSSAIAEADTATSFWKIISSALLRASQFPGQSEQLFELAEQVFRKYDEHNRDEASLRSYLATWSALLLNYHHDENVGRDETDFVVIGFTKLLLSCVSSLKSFKKPLNSGSLVEGIWNKFLFAPRIMEIDDQSPGSYLPVLESNTRKELYELVLALAEDRGSYGSLLDMVGNLRNDDVDMALQPVCFDRTNEIRAPTGYVGLFNPRAICYMNSLLTQLFMNMNFRKFVLGLNVTDPLGAQRLLHQTQKLFAEMQNSYRKAADPRGFAACVKAPEGVPIDINIQMDADEFYNLLFDQWEGQMLSPAIKEQFRSFYGGHTVNQIKSKECEHVSERVESFFVVQCDVQGKQSLIESLQSFVEGDVMEGDNKYKCEACGGKLVDAVKRTCLKDVPDNLIFHLKRFDFDLVELRRAKINDHFEFPSCIDVSPFKVDHLSDPSKPREEDIFELVGVLVHQGTSENGHYYSYIRERPCASGSMTQWVEFNDRDVDAFDHQSIPYQAYGGFYDEQFPRQQKQFSAYMLFYQRRSAIEKDHREYMGSPQSGIAKVPVPPSLDRSIQADNNLIVREYSLYDPHHTKFVRQILANVRTINHGTCSEDHGQETQALHIVLVHLCQTLFRAKTADNFDETILQLRKAVLSCSTCCQVALKWLADQEYALINLLLQCIHGKVRSQIRTFLLDSLLFLRDKDPAAYGIEGMETDCESGSAIQPSGILVAVAKALYDVCQNSYLSIRGWDDLYLTLCGISDMGHVETAVLLDQNFLDHSLRIFCMHANQNFRAKEPDLWRVVEKKKRIFNRVIEFVYTLLAKVDLQHPVITNNRSSRLDKCERNGFKFPLSRAEHSMLHFWHDDNKAYAFLDKMLETFDSTKTEIFYPGEILKWMLQSVDPRTKQYLFYTVYEGVSQLSPPSSDPYVRAALPYCEACREPNHVDQVIEVVARQVAKYRDGGGEVNIRFFSGLLGAENKYVLEAKGADYFYSVSLALARRISIPLLLYDEEGIRKAAALHLDGLFTRHQDDEHTAEDILKQKYKVARSLASDLCDKIVEEYDNTTSRSYIQPMVQVCQILMRLIQALYESDDPSLEPFQSGNDPTIMEKFESFVAPRLHNWPMDTSTPISTGEPYDHSDYGSESDMDPELLDI